MTNLNTSPLTPHQQAEQALRDIDKTEKHPKSVLSTSFKSFGLKWILANVNKPADNTKVIVYVPSLCNKTVNDDGIRFGRWIADLNEWRIEGSNNGWDVTHYCFTSLPLK